MDIQALNNLIGQLRAASDLAAGRSAAPQATQSGGFGELLKSSLEQVNGAQQLAERVARDYELGSSNVNLQDAMIAAAKANISFQATVQVRNRLVSAYHDIMNMPV